MEYLKREFNLGGEVSPPFLEILNTVVTFYGKERVDVQDNSIIIHYPKLVISNNANMKHIIRDLYITLRLTNQSSLYNYTCIRTTFTRDEFMYGYTHSHIPRTIFLYSYRGLQKHILNLDEIKSYKRGLSFCTGKDTPLALAEEAVVRSPDLSDLNALKFKWISFLTALDTALCWESLNGGPYAKIQYIGVSNYTHRINSERNIEDTILSNNSTNDFVYCTNNGQPTELPIVPICIIIAKIFIRKLRNNEISEDIINNKIRITTTTQDGDYMRLNLDIEEEYLKYFIINTLEELDFKILLPFILYKNLSKLLQSYVNYNTYYNSIHVDSIPMLSFKGEDKQLKILGNGELSVGPVGEDNITLEIFKGFTIPKLLIKELQTQINALFTYEYRF